MMIMIIILITIMIIKHDIQSYVSLVYCNRPGADGDAGAAAGLGGGARVAQHPQRPEQAAAIILTTTCLSSVVL